MFLLVAAAAAATCVDGGGEDSLDLPVNERGEFYGASIVSREYLCAQLINTMSWNNN